MDGPIDQPGTPGSAAPVAGNGEGSPLTRRSLLTWLGRASVLGLFSPVIDACVRGTGATSLDRGGLPDLAGGFDAGFDLPGETGRDGGGDEGGDGGPGDPGAPDAAEEAGTEDVAAEAGADAEDATSPLCDPAFAPGTEELPVFQAWGERTVDRQDIAAILATWRLTIDGLVDTPITYDFCQLRDLGLVDQVMDFHCVEGWDVLDVPWNGIPLSRLLDLAGIRPEARFLKFTSVGSRYTESLSLDVAREPHTMLALGIGGNTLSLKHGFPVRIVVPRLFGYKNPKFVTRIEATVTEHVGFWPRVGYTVAGEVQPERLRPGKY